MANINIGGRLHSTATGNVVTGANEVFDDAKGKKQSTINAELEEAIQNIPEQEQSDWNQADTTAKDYIKNKPSIPSQVSDVVKYTPQELDSTQKEQARTNIGAGTSDFSGNYNDLSNKPTIPTVPAISTNISTDATSDTKTASPKAVKDYVDANSGAGAVKYTEQSLTPAEKEQARSNIGAQELLASGTNIKTINQTSILGSGDITVQDGADGVGFDSVATPSTTDGTVIITLTNGDTITLDLNHNHAQYSKVVECNSVAEYEAITTKDSMTLYIVPGVAMYLGETPIISQSGNLFPYTPVEYIETDGTAYINTGIKGNIPRSFELKITPPNVRTDHSVLGTRASASLRMLPLSLYTGKLAGFGYNSGAYNPIDITVSVDNHTPMEVRTHFRDGSQQIGVKQKGESTYTTVSKTVSGECATGLDIFLFTANSGGSPFGSCAGIRLHSVKIYSDSTYTTCVWDGQPCIYNGVYGMWDKVSNTFFGNANSSGAFSGPPTQLYDWSNFTWLLVGDSLTAFNARADMHYFDYIAEKTGINLINRGSSGKGYANGDYFYSLFHGISGTDFTFATIFGSGNDIRYQDVASLSSATSWENALGDVDDNGTTSICGYINRAIDEFYANAPLKKLGIITPTPWKNGSTASVSLTDEETARRLRTYSEKLALIAKKRGIPCLDLFNCSGLRPWNADFRVEYYNEGGVQDNGVHPNSKGHKWIANMFLYFLLQFIIE